ncbi:MFS transporter [Castellaniella sp.]|uniref:MFS transporter n=1 Tax=Castellaniella sp. TaxID=1955812 RepID=UPI00355CF48B
MFPATSLHLSQGDKKRLLLALSIVLVGVFAFIQVYSIQSILPEIRADLNATVVEAGQAVGITILAIALVAPFMGIVSDALGRKWFITGSVFFLAVPTALMMLVEDVHSLLLLRFLQGLAVPGVSVVITAYIGEEFSGARMVRTMTLYVCGCIMGGFLGRFMIGHLTEYMSWREAYGVMALFNLVGGVIIWRGLPASRCFKANPNVHASLVTLRRLLHSRDLRVASLVGATLLFSQIALFTYINLHLASAPYHYSPGNLANLFTVYLLGMMVMPVMGYIIPRIGIRNAILLSLGLSMGAVALTLVQPAWLIIVALALAACGTFIAQSAVMSFVAQRMTEGRSLANGLYYTVYYCGGFLGAWACGLAYAWHAWPATVATLLLTQLAGWLVAWWYIPGPARP